MDNQNNDQEKINEILNNMTHVIEKGKLNDFKDFLRAVGDIQNKDLFRTCYNNREIDIVTMICKHNKRKLLNYLLHESHILHYFTINDKNKEQIYREDALYHAMCLHHFELIEILYDHWTGDLHWMGHLREYSNFDIGNLNQLNSSLQKALRRYENRILSKTFLKRKIDQYMMFHIQGLVGFNEFQRDVYSKLKKLKENLLENDESKVNIRLKETFAIREMILSVINCYEEHNKKTECMIQSSVIEDPLKFLECLQDTSTLLPNLYLFVIYEVFYRKLDYNICLLILDNLHSLKLRLSMPDDSYQKLENKVYHFFYQINGKWSLYLPKRKRMKSITFYAQHRNTNCWYTLKFNANVFKSGPHIIYLERSDFEKAVNDFKKSLMNQLVKENMREDRAKLPNEEINCLISQPDLRDIYSLKRMSQHIAQLYSIDESIRREYVFLLVERALQVVGEFLKSTNETLHLQPSTEALIKVEISVEVVSALKVLRDLLCHAKDGELFKRIETETNNGTIFETVLKELIIVKNKIDEVIVIHKPLVERSLIINGLTLVHNRRNELPPIVGNDFFIILRDLRLNISDYCCRLAKEKIFYKTCWEPNGYTEDLMGEVKILLEHSLKLESKLLLVISKIRYNLTRKFSMYKETINNSLEIINVCQENWQHIVKTVTDQIQSCTFLDYPNEKDANKIKSLYYLKKFDLEDDYHKGVIENNMLFAEAESHWKFIKDLLDFIILKTHAQPYTPDELKRVSEELKTISEGYRNVKAKKAVNDYLAIIEKTIDTPTNTRNQEIHPPFKGIKELTIRLTMSNFLTYREKINLTSVLNVMKNKVSEKKQEKIDNLIKKINNDTAVPKREITGFVDSLKLDSKLQSILMNLVMGYQREPALAWCLSRRIGLLRQITNNQCAKELVLRYKFDKPFSLAFEVLLFDVFTTLEGTKDNEIMKKSSKLLTEINLRNILIHASPLLEIASNVLDPNDLPAELIAKALDFVKDETSINALCVLRDADFDFTKINDNFLSTEKQELVNIFKTSNRWTEYLKLITKPMRCKHNKITPENIEKSLDLKLIDAVKNKETLLVKKHIEDGANVKFVDSVNYGVLHCAAMKGSVDVMAILLNNGADVNGRCKNNMTALHISAMNGFDKAVDYLLRNGGDCYAVDNRDRSPLNLAHQRQHFHVCQILEDAMKK